jgi:hypothetical protein
MLAPAGLRPSNQLEALRANSASSETCHYPKGSEQEEERHSDEYRTQRLQEMLKGSDAAAPVQQAEPQLQAQWWETRGIVDPGFSKRFEHTSRLTHDSLCRQGRRSLM